MRRAGLDYREYVDVREYQSLQQFKLEMNPGRILAVSTRGSVNYAEIAFLFGPETRGLPASLLEEFPSGEVIRIPMQSNSRSLNLSNAVAVIVYEAWRQSGFI